MAKKKVINRSSARVVKPKAVYAGKVIRNTRTKNSGSLGSSRSSSKIGSGCKNCG